MQKNTKKIVHLSIITIIIVAILFTALIFILRYNEKGEFNMPFEISKITVISTTDAQDVKDEKNRWNEKVSQNNDIYIDIKKNENYLKNRIIKNVTVNNFNIVKDPIKGKINFYKPSINEVKNFENKDEYIISELIFNGDKINDMKKLLISNQGGRLAFRCGNVNIGSYISNEGTELNFSKLLSKIGVKSEEINAKISFDIMIALTNGTVFKTNIEVEIPAQGIIENGTSSIEIEKPEVIFKRIEN